jgi:hypothetical protein
MTLSLAFAAPDYALVANDTRVRYYDHAGTRLSHRDTGRKLHALAGAWLTGGDLESLAAWTAQYILHHRPVDERTRPRLAAIMPLPARVGHDAGLFLVQRDAAGFSAYCIDLTTRQVERGGTGVWGALPYTGDAAQEARCGALVAAVQADGPLPLYDFLRRLGALYADMHRLLGPEGSVSDQVEIGLLQPDAGSGVVQRRLGPLPAEEVRSLSDAAIEDILVAVAVQEAGSRVGLPLSDDPKRTNPDGNLILNGNFEESAFATPAVNLPIRSAYWDISTVQLENAGNRYEGLWSIKFEQGGASTTTFDQIDRTGLHYVAVRPGDFLRLTGVGKVGASHADTLALEARFFDADQGLLSTAVGPTWSTETTFTVKTAIVLVPASAAYVVFRGRFTTASGVAIYLAWLDNLEARLAVTTSNLATAASLNAMAGVSPDRGDANVTLVLGVDEPVQRFATTLTANRTVTLSGTGAFNGGAFRIVRTGLGAFTLDVGGLKTIPSATAAFVEVGFDGSAWRLLGYGAL